MENAHGLSLRARPTRLIRFRKPPLHSSQHRRDPYVGGPRQDSPGAYGRADGAVRQRRSRTGAAVSRGASHLRRRREGHRHDALPPLLPISPKRGELTSRRDHERPRRSATSRCDHGGPHRPATSRRDHRGPRWSATSHRSGRRDHVHSRPSLTSPTDHRTITAYRAPRQGVHGHLSAAASRRRAGA